MAPKQQDNTEVADEVKDFSSKSNNELIEGAGEVHMDEGVLWGKAVIQEFKRTVGTNWVKEMTNFNQKTVAVTFLMFISVIAPTLTFGAVYGKVTNNFVGAVEVILATSWVGSVYALIGGMPVVSTRDRGRMVMTSLATFLLTLPTFSKPVHYRIHWSSHRIHSGCSKHVEQFRRSLSYLQCIHLHLADDLLFYLWFL